MNRIVGAMLVCLLSLGGSKVFAQTDEVQQLLLNVEKLNQLREMLDNMRDKYQILSQGYNQVRSIAEGNFTLHEGFLNRLVRVNPNVKAYYKVGEIIRIQIALAGGISKVQREFGDSDFLRNQEYSQLDRLFGVWSKSSLDLLQELMLILSDNELQMNDWERIQAIDRVHSSVTELSKGVSQFSNSLAQLGQLRKAGARENTTLQNLLKND